MQILQTTIQIYLGSHGKLETGRPNSWDSEGPWALRRVKAPPRRIVEAQRPDPVITTDPHRLLQAVICLPLTSSLFPSLSCDICRWNQTFCLLRIHWETDGLILFISIVNMRADRETEKHFFWCFTWLLTSLIFQTPMSLLKADFIPNKLLIWGKQLIHKVAYVSFLFQ